MYQPRLSVVNHQTHVAVIGCGYWGMNYVRVLSELPDSRVTVVCDERAGRLDEVARRFPDVQLTTSIEEALDDDAVEAAVICTQAATHREIAGRALELGKHVLVEKPFTVDVAEADELDRARGEGRPGPPDRPHVPLQRRRPQREDAAWTTARSATCTTCTRAARTSVRSARTSTRSGTSRRTTSRSSTTCSTTRPTVGQRGRQRASCATAGRTSASSRSAIRSGLVGHIHVSWADPHKVREFVVVGSDRRHRLQRPRRRRARPGLRQGRARRDPDDEPTTFGEHHLQIRDGRHHEPGVVAGTEPLKHLSGHFLHCIRRGDRPQHRRARTGATWWRHGGGRAVAGEQRRARHRGGARHVWSRTRCRSRSLTSPPSSAIGGRAAARRSRSALSRTRLDPRRGGRCVRAGVRRRTARCRYAVGVDSGLSALELVLRALGIGPGDEVITAANTFIATVLAISHAGATPVLVDVDPETHTLDPEQVAAAVTPRTQAIVPVHLYGQPAEMDAIMSIADARGLFVVEDACQAHGARYRGTPRRLARATQRRSASTRRRTSGRSATAA